MAFTTWSALKTAIKDAIADYVAGSPVVGEYTIGNRTMKYRSISDLERLYKFACRMESMESGPRSSFGRHRRFD